MKTYDIVVDTTGEVIGSVSTLEEFFRFTDDYFNYYEVNMYIVATDENNIYVKYIRDYSAGM